MFSGSLSLIETFSKFFKIFQTRDSNWISRPVFITWTRKRRPEWNGL